MRQEWTKNRTAVYRALKQLERQGKPFSRRLIHQASGVRPGSVPHILDWLEFKGLAKKVGTKHEWGAWKLTTYKG